MATTSSNIDYYHSLSTMATDVKRVLELFPTDKLSWKPKSWDGNPGENFSAIAQISHLRDVEIDGYHFRIQAMLTENKPTLNSLDGYGLAIQRGYENNSLTKTIDEFEAAREKTIMTINNIQSDHWSRSGYFEGYGYITLKSLVHFLCSHDFEHLASLRWLLGKLEGDKLGE